MQKNKIIKINLNHLSLQDLKSLNIIIGKSNKGKSRLDEYYHKVRNGEKN